MLRHVHVVPGYIVRTVIDEHRRSQARSRGIARDQSTPYRGNIGLRRGARGALWDFSFTFARLKCISIILPNIQSPIYCTSSTIIQSNKFLCVFFKNW